jgi:hypothetical protein
MVRALLDGRKTQTRRIVKPQPPAEAVDAGVIMSGSPAANGVWCWLDSRDLLDASQVGDDFRCPYGVPGDRLWVKETWGLNDYRYEREPIPKARPADLDEGGLTFRATEWDTEVRNELRWRPSIHMPRWASRLTLAITDVRVERLHDISEGDAWAEGISIQAPPDKDGGRHFGVDGMKIDEKTAARAFGSLWSGINGPDNWDANPWVWAVTFQVET